MENPVMQTIGINKYFYEPTKIRILSDITFAIERGAFLTVVGKSGCGKSTLLYILSTMDTDYTGELYIDGELMTNKPQEELARVRNKKIGFVFQFHYLIEEFNVLHNVMLPALKLGQLPHEEIAQRALELLKTLGIEDHAHKRPHQLSGGEKQRVAIARAMINDPLIIMGDEPTGNLDKKNSQLVFELFREISFRRKQTVLVVTHDNDFARGTDRIIEMEDGRIRI